MIGRNIYGNHILTVDSTDV